MIMALALGASMLGIAACGGDDNGGGGDSGVREELTLADYFSTYQAINKAAEEQFDSIAPDIGGSDATLDERKLALVAFLEEIRDIAREFVAEFEDIDPPDEAQALHEDSLGAGNDLVEAIDGIIDDVEDFDSLSDILDFDVPELDAASERLDAICADLQKLADDEEIDVGLGCE
jgi:hypothetical protein